MDLGQTLIELDRSYKRAEHAAEQFHALAQLEQRPRPEAVKIAITHYANLVSEEIAEAERYALSALTITVRKTTDDITGTQEIDGAQASEIERRIVSLRKCESLGKEFKVLRERWYRGVYEGPECDVLREAIRIADENGP